MNVVRDEAFEQELIYNIYQRELHNRVGVHSSDLIYCLNKQALRKLHPLSPVTSEILLFSIGWATQRWLTNKDEDEPEIIVDGITVTPDATYLNVPWELKATYQSSEKPITENVSWFRQIMAQCYVTKTLTAHLSRFEIMGNWKSIFGKKEEKALESSRKPTLHAYSLSFTEEELQQNWDWLKERKDVYEKILSSGTLVSKPIALAQGMNFECNYCSYKEDYCNV